MPKRLATLATLVVTGLLLLALLSPTYASAAQPWWQVVTGSRPTNLWEPEDSVQEIQAGPFVTIVQLNETNVACMFSPFCTFFGLADSETALQLQEALEAPAAYGADNVEVKEEPEASKRFIVTSVGEDAGRPVPPLGVVGEGTKARVLHAGGSGRLVLTLTNLGDAPVDGTGTPVTILDQLPQGAIATGVEAFAGGFDTYGPVDCAVEGPHEVACSYDGKLPPYQAIEVEIFTSLEGSPPSAGAPGQVTVSGGGAASASAMQSITVSDEPVRFGIERFSAAAEEEGGGPVEGAGSHPFQFTTTVQPNAGEVHPTPTGLNADGRYLATELPGIPRNLSFSLPAGLVGNAAAIPQCKMETFLPHVGELINTCPDSTVVGVAAVTVVENSNFGLISVAVPVFNLPPAFGEPARFGFVAVGVPVLIDTEVDPKNDYRISARVSNISQSAQFLSATTTLWGAPGDPRHDTARGWNCVWFRATEPCVRPPGLAESAFMRMPVQCSSPLDFGLSLEPWNTPLDTQVASASFTSDPLQGCNIVPFDPSIEAAATSGITESPSGLNFSLKMPNSGLLNGEGIAEGQPKKVEVGLPEGMTINPSQAEGLVGCSPAEYARETASSKSGEGCPEASKVGTVQIATPLLEEEAHGSVYVATPHDNPFGSLLSLYMVAKIPERGILIKQAGKVEPDPVTGRLTTTFDNLPQLPFSRFEFHFKEGPRAPLVMPGACGSYDITAKFTPWNAVDPNNPQPNEIVTRTSQFTVNQGPNGSPCPRGTPPFNPKFIAGTENNEAGTYSPFNARLTREDGEQEFSRFSLKLPKGVIGNLSGIPFCSEAAIAQARNRTGANGGQEELDDPSCPAASQVGRTLVGAGVGQALTYVPGKLYLAGPYRGAKLSAVAITPAKVGPFDLGNVVIRQALKVDPMTAEVSTDGSSADPIPHILQGIVIHARDIRIYVDRKDFVLNPTSCERMTASASVSGLSPVDVTSPFQAADCASLGFKPKLALSLKGGTKRGAHPRLKAVLTARKGDANIGAAVVKLPHSEFLEQGHIRTICTRVQFAAGAGNGSQCPTGSVYGRAKAMSPLLDEPLVGNVYLRSSNHPLPDLVAALHSKKVDIDLVGRIDSVNGGIRNSFEAVPDAPVKKFVLEMQGGRKGLLVNSTDICRGKHRAKATFTGQNGKQHVFNPLLKARCGGKPKRRSSKH